MVTTKTKTMPRLVVRGAIRFGARTFTCPEIMPLSNTTVYVAYDTLMDTELDIMDENMDVIATALPILKAVA